MSDLLDLLISTLEKILKENNDGFFKKERVNTAVNNKIGVNRRAGERETRTNEELISAVRDRMVNGVV